MNLLEKLELYRCEYEKLQALGEGFLAQAEPEMADIENLLVERERCILLMQRDALSIGEKQKLKQLIAVKSEELSQQDRQLAALYQSVLAQNQEAIRQDQAMTLRLRGIQKQSSDELKVVETNRKISNYGKTFLNGIDAGARFNRLR